MQEILVVDDDSSTRRLIAGLLRAQSFAVTEAADGFEALERVEQRPFDLVLVDVWMPRMTGLDLLARLRERSTCPKVVVMTADDTPEVLLRSVREQAFRYVRKPVEPASLLELVREVLTSKPASRPIQVISARPDWVELLVPCEKQSAERVHALLTRMDADLPDQVRESIAMAFRELLMNAVEWGGKLDSSRDVRIAYLRARRMVLYRISDPGKGFKFEDLEHSAIANAQEGSFEHVQVREQKGLRPGGFGLMMTRALVDELIYNEAQNEVVFIKYLD